MPFFKVHYQGFVIIETDSIEETKEDLHEYLSIYEEEEITKTEEMDPVDVLDLTGVTLHCED